VEQRRLGRVTRQRKPNDPSQVVDHRDASGLSLVQLMSWERASAWSSCEPCGKPRISAAQPRAIGKLHKKARRRDFATTKPRAAETERGPAERRAFC
jgi:hypothetical protein